LILLRFFDGCLLPETSICCANLPMCFPDRDREQPAHDEKEFRRVWVNLVIPARLFSSFSAPRGTSASRVNPLPIRR
jgi:hypothetical protein